MYNSDNGFTHGLAVYVRRFDIRVGEYVQIIADMDWESAQIVHGDDSLMSGAPAHTDGPE